LIKEQLIGQHLISREDSQSELSYLLSAEIDGNANEAFVFEKKISNVKLADVKKMAKLAKYSVLTLVPE
jgi:predicted Zn-dependent peptidase